MKQLRNGKKVSRQDWIDREGDKKYGFKLGGLAWITYSSTCYETGKYYAIRIADLLANDWLVLDASEEG